MCRDKDNGDVAVGIAEEFNRLELPVAPYLTK